MRLLFCEKTSLEGFRSFMFNAWSNISTITSCHLELQRFTRCKTQDSDHTNLRLNGGLHWSSKTADARIQEDLNIL
jgi:hypothetical protein